MNSLPQALVRQSVVLPILALVEIAIGIFTPGYDSVAQHLSALGVGDSTVALYINTSALLMGASVCLFALGLQLLRRSPAWSPWLILIFGISMISNGLFEMGSPMHGLRGIGMVITIAPLACAAEFRDFLRSSRYEAYSLIVTIASFAYLWMLVTGAEPRGYAGLTQRIASLVTYGWFAVSAWSLSADRIHRVVSTKGLSDG